jgi:beta-phosphoglucomutase-like phosphatase (HAD superfamily)
MSQFLTKSSFNKYNTVIFDLSGVLIDFGVRIPYIAMNKAFKMNNINVTPSLINFGIGRNENKHIKTLCLLNDKSKYKKVIYDYNNILIHLHNHEYYNNPIKGSIVLTHKFKQMNYNIAIMTSYNINMKSIIDKRLHYLGYNYDYFICNNDVKNSRPNSDMLYNIIDNFNTTPDKCIKIGESYLNLFETSNINMDTINIIDSSRDMGLEEIEFDDISKETKHFKRQYIVHNLMKYPNPKYMVNSINTINNII